MREATKELTKFTNKWKKFPEQRNEFYDQSERLTLAEIRNHVQATTLPMKATRRFGEVQVFQPAPPSPKQEQTDARISFLANKEEISLVGRYFFEEPGFKNEDVGKRSFALALTHVRQAAE